MRKMSWPNGVREGMNRVWGVGYGVWGVGKREIGKMGENHTVLLVPLVLLVSLVPPDS
jgi:hypothetical protein